MNTCLTCNNKIYGDSIICKNCYIDNENPNFLIYCTNGDNNKVSLKSDFFCDDCLKNGDT